LVPRFPADLILEAVHRRRQRAWEKKYTRDKAVIPQSALQVVVYTASSLVVV